MNHLRFSGPERFLAFLAGVFNLIVGLGFFLLPEIQQYLPMPIWPTPIAPLLTRFIGAIVVGNAAGAFWLVREREWARVRPLALVAVVYGTMVAGALLYHLLRLNAQPIFWLYFAFDASFLFVYYVLFIYHDLVPLMTKRPSAYGSR